MKQPGRRSAASLAAVSLTGRRPAPTPPPSLTAAEVVVWRRTVSRAPVGFFQPEMADVLAAYCAHTCEAERLRLAARDPDLTLPEFAKILGLQQRESSLALAYARAMRLTVQSRLAARSAGVKEARPDVQALWHRDVEPAETSPDDGESVDA